MTQEQHEEIESLDEAIYQMKVISDDDYVMALQRIRDRLANEYADKPDYATERMDGVKCANTDCKYYVASEVNACGGAEHSGQFADRLSKTCKDYKPEGEPCGRSECANYNAPTDNPFCQQCEYAKGLTK